jgi:hypothetical protein
VAATNCLQAGACVVECSGPGTGSPAAPSAGTAGPAGSPSTNSSTRAPAPSSSSPKPGAGAPTPSVSSGSRRAGVPTKLYGLAGTMAAALALT